MHLQRQRLCVQRGRQLANQQLSVTLVEWVLELAQTRRSLTSASMMHGRFPLATTHALYISVR